jgi:choline kinase
MSTVVLLGAGLGARLRPLTDDRPKAVVEVAGEPLAVRMLRQFAERGVRSATVLVGHFAARARELIGPRVRGTGGAFLDVRFVENAEYATTNTMYSLLLGMDALTTGGGFVVEGDIIAGEAVLDRLLAASPERSHWAVDAWTPAHTGSRLTDDGEGHIVQQEIWRGATTGPTPHLWKSAGMLRLSSAGARHLAAALAHEAELGNRGIYYDDVIGKYLRGDAASPAPALREPFAIDVLDLQGAPWMEIDDLHDMAQARSLFEPAGEPARDRAGEPAGEGGAP